MKVTHNDKFLKKLFDKNTHFKEGRLTFLEFLDGKEVSVQSKYGTHVVNRGDLLKGQNVTIKSSTNKTEYIKNVFTEVHGSKYGYSDVEYQCMKSKVKIVCDIHGVFEQSPDSHRKGYGCSKCGYQKNMPNLDYALSELRNNNFDDSLSFKIHCFEGNRSVLHVTCAERHEYKTTISNRLKYKYGCKECHKKYLYISNNIKDECYKNIKCSLYFLKFEYKGEVFYKVGISKNLRKRVQEFRSKTPYNVELIRHIETDLEDAFKREQNYLFEYKVFKHFPKYKFGGDSECFKENPTNLDNWQYEYYNEINYEQNN